MRPGDHLVCTDGAGAYLLHVDPGQYTLRVSRAGYIEQLVDIDVGLDPQLGLDFSMAPLAQPLQGVRVVGRVRGGDADSATSNEWDDEPGTWSASRRDLQNRSSLVGGDVLLATSLPGGIASASEAPTSLHVRGGAGDQNVVLLDGIPLYNATHFGGVLSAVNPDVVSGSTMHAGVPSARFGDALSSVVELRTDQTPRTRVSYRGAVDASTTRQEVFGPLAGGRGSFALAGRVVSRELLGSFERRTSSVTSFGDVFGRVTLPLRGGTLEALSINASDRLIFNAVATGDKPSGVSEVPAGTDGARNRFEWSSHTVGLVWKGDVRPTTALRLRLWRTAFDGHADWAAPERPLGMQSGLQEYGIGADVERRARGGFFAGGVRVVDRTSSYRVASLGGRSIGNALRTSFGVAGRSPLLALYAEHRALGGTRWALLSGIRAEFGVGRIPATDPRISLRFTPGDRLTLLAGYGRMHQFTQSLGNDESLVDALVGVGLPALANGKDRPVAVADQVSIGARVSLGVHTRLSVESYARRLGHLMLVAPGALDPFARAIVPSGSGRAFGASAWFEHTGARLSLLSGYTYGVTDREVGGVRYMPTFGAQHAVVASLALHLDHRTDLQLIFRGDGGRRGRTHAGVLEWPVGTILTEVADLSGTPVLSADAVGASPLRPYARTDLIVQHEWRVAAASVRGRLTGRLRVENVFSRSNALGVYVPPAGGPRRVLPMSPRALRIGLAWEF